MAQPFNGFTAWSGFHPLRGFSRTTLSVPTFSELCAGIVTWCSEPLAADLTRM